MRFCSGKKGFLRGNKDSEDQNVDRKQNNVKKVLSLFKTGNIKP